MATRCGNFVLTEATGSHGNVPELRFAWSGLRQRLTTLLRQPPDHRAYSVGLGSLRRMIGAIRDDDGSDMASHVWVLVDGKIVVDITASTG